MIVSYTFEGSGGVSGVSGELLETCASQSSVPFVRR